MLSSNRRAFEFYIVSFLVKAKIYIGFTIACKLALIYCMFSSPIKKNEKMIFTIEEWKFNVIKCFTCKLSIYMHSKVQLKFIQIVRMFWVQFGMKLMGATPQGVMDL